MNVFERIWNNIVSSNDAPYINKINELEGEVKFLDKENDYLEEQIDLKDDSIEELEEMYFDLGEDNKTLLEELESYKLSIKKTKCKRCDKI